jgi:penicillin-binding protein 1A
LVPAGLPVVPSSAVVEHVLDELATRDGLGVDDLLRGDVQVHATVDAGLQRLAGQALEDGLARYEQRHPGGGVVQGAVVVLANGDGSVLAEVGGRQGYAGRATSFRDFNRVRQSRRQPGSAMKPIVYLAAFRRGFTLETLVPDEPISVADGAPGVRKWIANYDGQFKGPVPIRTALAESRNAVAVWITTEIGIDAVLREARRLGVETQLQPYVTTALGASEVTLLELASAYRAIASGVIAVPHVIRRVVRATDETGPPGVARPAPSAVRDVALLTIQEGLRGVIRMPTGTAHALDARTFRIAVMGKTGTTNEFRDAIFVGSTYGIDGITVAVRIGFDDNRSLGPRETGGRVALPVFRDVMTRAYASGLVGPVPRFPVPMEARLTLALERELQAAVVPAPAASFAAVQFGTAAPSRLPLE